MRFDPFNLSGVSAAFYPQVGEDQGKYLLFENPENKEVKKEFDDVMSSFVNPFT